MRREPKNICTVLACVSNEEAWGKRSIEQSERRIGSTNVDIQS